MKPKTISPEDALSWIVKFSRADIQEAPTQWMRGFEWFSTALLDGWVEQPSRYLWKGQQAPEPNTTVEELQEFKDRVDTALFQATEHNAAVVFLPKFPASANNTVFINVDEDDYSTTPCRLDAAAYLLRSIIRWNKSADRLRLCPEWNKDQKAKIKCLRFFLTEVRSNEMYCQSACGERANKRNQRK